MGLASGVPPGGRDEKYLCKFLHETDHVQIAGLGGAGSANFVAKPTLILPLMGHLILSTKQEWNYGGVRNFLH
jgi:hypothetical protein